MLLQKENGIKVLKKYNICILHDAISSWQSVEIKRFLYILYRDKQGSTDLVSYFLRNLESHISHLYILNSISIFY
jgi:hypothetical protein